MASSPTRLHIDPDGKSLARRCLTQKVCWDTKDAALDAAELMMLKGQVNPGCHITPYACEECGFWHVANKVIVPVGRKWKN